MDENNSDRSSIQNTKEKLHALLSSKNTVMIGGILFAVILSIYIAFSATSASLPGEPLYAVKTNVLEEFIETAQLSDKNKAKYQIAKMEARLREVKALSMKESVSEAALFALIAQTAEHTQTLNMLIHRSIDSAFSKTEILETLNEFASVAGAIETISENDPKLISIGDAVEENRQETIRLYKDRVESFTETETPSAVLEYLQLQLAEVRDGLGDKALSERTVDLVENYLDRVPDSISTNNLQRALSSTDEAYRLIRMEQYSGTIIRTDANTINIPASSSSTATTSLQQSTSTETLTP